MKTGKREIALLVVLGVILYAFVFYKFIWLKAGPQIEDVKVKIEKKTAERDALDRDLANIENLKRSLSIKKVQNERLEEYLMSEANFTDSIDYIDKLIKLFDNNMSEVQLAKPSSLTAKNTGTSYYSFGIKLSTVMTYDGIMELVDYIEGGTRKVSITNFEMQPEGKNEIEIDKKVADATVENKMKMMMTVNIYSLNFGSSDKLYQYSSKKFNTYRETDGIVFVPISSNTVNDGKNNSRPSSGNGVNTGHSAGASDLRVVVESFLAAGENFWVYGNGNERTPIRYKTKKPIDVKLTFSESSYSVYSVNDKALVQEISGLIIGDDIDLLLRSNFHSSVTEDKDLGADISIINNSSKRIKVTLNDIPKRIRIKDRNGNIIYRQNDTEKLFVL